MALIRKISLNDLQQVGIWNIVESTDQLLALAKKTNVDVSDFPHVKNDLRNKQWIATRLLLAQFYPNAVITYNQHGKPQLSNQIEISISHAKHYVVVHLSQKKTNGIDIEEISPKVDRIKHKFLGKNDCLTEGTLEELTLCWSTKEALYKYYGKREVDFIAHLHVNAINHSNQRIHGKINMPTIQTKVELGWKKIDNFVLVYTI